MGGSCGGWCCRYDVALWGVDVGGGGGDDMVAVVGHDAVAMGRRAAPVWLAGALDGGSWWW